MSEEDADEMAASVTRLISLDTLFGCDGDGLRMAVDCLEACWPSRGGRQQWRVVASPKMAMWPAPTTYVHIECSFGRCRPRALLLIRE